MVSEERHHLSATSEYCKYFHRVQKSSEIFWIAILEAFSHKRGCFVTRNHVRLVTSANSYVQELCENICVEHNPSWTVLDTLKLRNFKTRKTPTQIIIIVNQTVDKSICSHHSGFSYALFTLQAVHPMVRSFSRMQNRLQVDPFRLCCSHYNQTATDWTRFLTINNSRMTVQMWITVKQPQLTFSSHRMRRPKPLLTLCCHVTPNHNLMYTVDHLFGYHS